MRKQHQTWFSEYTDTTLTKKKLTAEIHRIAALKAPVTKKLNEIRDLIESYFKIDSNEEFLNANL